MTCVFPGRHYYFLLTDKEEVAGSIPKLAPLAGALHLCTHASAARYRGLMTQNSLPSGSAMTTQLDVALADVDSSRPE